VIADVTREAVLAAIAECDRAGLDAFLSWHGFGRAASWNGLWNVQHGAQYFAFENRDHEHRRQEDQADETRPRLA